MTDAAAIAVSSPANDLRLSISTSEIENVFTHEDRGSDPIIAECIDTDISVETLAPRREMAREACAPALASPKTAARDGAIAHHIIGNEHSQKQETPCETKEA
jgi:hypothetical protein